MGFKTAVQKAAFKHEQVFFPSHLQLNKCDFRLLRLSLSLFLSPSSSSPPLSPLVLFTCKSQSCTRYAGGLSPPRFDFFSNQVLKKELLALHRDWAAFYNPEKMHFEKTISICHLNWGGGGNRVFFWGCWCKMVHRQTWLSLAPHLSFGNVQEPPTTTTTTTTWSRQYFMFVQISESYEERCHCQRLSCTFT